MSTAPASHPAIPRAAMASLAGRMLSSLSFAMREDLCRHAVASAPRLRAALQALFLSRFGEQPGVERLRFLFCVAPLVRRLVIGTANLNGRIGATEITFADVKSWLEWLDSMDPLCSRMIDLRYFAGLSVKETASLLDLPPAAIVRELRFARAWLRIKESPRQ
ncbi:MAG: ECF-type sigma factor [Pseudomonadota bacterium]|nr:ECF-type sigma factor [Pseudomonadota bacterium]